MKGSTLGKSAAGRAAALPVFDGMASRVPSITPVAMSAPLLKQEARLEWVADQVPLA